MKMDNVMDFNAPPKKEPEAGAGSLPTIYDVSTTDFEQNVMLASMDMPVIVDFWAPWCGPCKQMMPALEKVISENEGKIRLAKLNIDENPELAQALRVQSVPTIFAFFGGQPVTAFAGAKPESELRRFVGDIIKMARQSLPDAVDIPATMAQADKALAEEDISAAQALYMQVLGEDENHAAAYAGLVRTFIIGGQWEQAQSMIDEAPDAVTGSDALKAAQTALEMAQNATAAADTAAFDTRLVQDENDHEARFERAMALFAAGEKERAIDDLVEIARRDRSWEDDKARLQLLKLFEALGMADPLTVSGRRKLSAVLFS